MLRYNIIVVKIFYCKLIKLTGGGVMFRLRDLIETIFHRDFHEKPKSEFWSESEADDLNKAVDDINKCYLKFEGSDIKCVGDVDVFENLEKALSQGNMLSGVLDSLVTVALRITGQTRDECYARLVQVVEIFNENTVKISYLANYLYGLSDYSENDYGLKISFEKAAKNINRLVSANGKVLDIVSELYINLNDLNSNYSEAAKSFCEQSNEILDKVN